MSEPSRATTATHLEFLNRPVSGKLRAKKSRFDEEFNAFWAMPGDSVQFRNARNNTIEWRVAEIELDFQACKWTKGGKKPLFIKLERSVIVAGPLRRTRVETCWTYTSALKQPKE